jgi:hypothetical protein
MGALVRVIVSEKITPEDFSDQGKPCRLKELPGKEKSTSKTGSVYLSTPETWRK